MTYTDELAAAVFAANPTLAPTTLGVWKTRGQIPRKYFNLDGTVRTADVPASAAHTEWAREILNLTVLNISALKSIKRTVLFGIASGRVVPKRSEAEALFAEISELSKRAAACAAAKTIDQRLRLVGALLKDTRIKHYTLCADKAETYVVDLLRSSPEKVDTTSEAAKSVLFKVFALKDAFSVPTWKMTEKRKSAMLDALQRIQQLVTGDYPDYEEICRSIDLLTAANDAA